MNKQEKQYIKSFFQHTAAHGIEVNEVTLHDNTNSINLLDRRGDNIVTIQLLDDWHIPTIPEETKECVLCGSVILPCLRPNGLVLCGNCYWNTLYDDDGYKCME